MTSLGGGASVPPRNPCNDGGPCGCGRNRKQLDAAVEKRIKEYRDSDGGPKRPLPSKEKLREVFVDNGVDLVFHNGTAWVCADEDCHHKIGQHKEGLVKEYRTCADADDDWTWWGCAPSVFRVAGSDAKNPLTNTVSLAFNAASLYILQHVSGFSGVVDNGLWFVVAVACAWLAVFVCRWWFPGKSKSGVRAFVAVLCVILTICFVCLVAEKRRHTA